MGIVVNLRERLAVSSEQYHRVAWAALISLTLIVFTGAGVRLSDSGLGCATWPKCAGGHVYPPLETHALIEFGNRVVGALVGLLCAAAVVLSYTRRPYRRDLMLLSWTLPAGVMAQAVLGGITVRQKLAPGWVISHFCLSMILVIGAVALVWRSRHLAGSRPAATDRLAVWSARGLLPLGALAIVAGTFATAAGPHSGGAKGQHIIRITFKGADTLQWMVQQHATIAALFGIAVVCTWLLHRRRGAPAESIDMLTALGVLVAAQGLVGSAQYELKLPTDMVWVHVALATTTWVVLLWTVAVQGRIAPRVAAPVPRGGTADAERAGAGPRPLEGTLVS
jgi:cytochrome c oxidase assembly protein subunit 15